MKNTFGLAVLLAALGWGQAISLAGEVIPVLKTGTLTLTNVEVLEVSDTQVYVRSGGAMGSLNLKDLDPELQKQFGYDSAKEAARQAARLNGAKPAVAPGAEQAVKPAYELSLTNKTAPSEWVEKDFAIGKTGALSLTLPKLWKESVQRTPAGETPAISVRIEPEFGSNFIFMVTTVPSSNCLNRLGGRGALEVAARPFLARSEERELRIQELNGQSGEGVYFTLSDKTLEQGPQKSNRHKYQSQGYLKLSDSALSFVVLYDYPDDMEFRAALKVIQTARFKTKEELRGSGLAVTN